MPAGWMHAAIDLIAYDEPHLALHQWKDRPSRWLGSRHRIERHEWYNAGLAGVWQQGNSTPPWLRDSIDTLRTEHGPDAAEQYMADLTHDEWDRLWDETSLGHRIVIEGFYAWLLFRPDVLEERFDIDVLRGRIRRLVDGELRWEPNEGVIQPYRRLRRYVRSMLRYRRELGEVIEAWETYGVEAFSASGSKK